MTPILTDEIVPLLLDPYGFYDGILAEPLLVLMRYWANRLAPEMSVTDFMLSYFDVLQDLRHDRRVGSPAVQRLLFAAFPCVVELVLPERAEEVVSVWRQTVQEIGVRGHHA